MGVYYYFINQRTKSMNKTPIDPGSEIYWYAKFDYYTETEQIEVFQRVISINPSWLTTDVIAACPDDGSGRNIVYSNGLVTYEDNGEC